MTTESGRSGAPPTLVAIGMALACLLGAAVAVRVYAASQTAVMFNDGPIFLALARAIQTGHWDAVLAHPFHPLYPAAIAGVATLFDVALERAAIGVSIAGGVMAVAGAGLAARRAFDAGIGWMVAWLVALHPWAVDFSSDVMSDGLYAGFYLLGFAALVPLVERPTIARGVACGACAAAAYLTRPEGVGLALVAIGLLVGRVVFDRRAPRGSLAAAIGVAVACTALMAPLVVPLSDQLGELTLTRKKSVAALVEGRSGVRVEEPRAAGPAAASIPLPRSSQRFDGPGAVRPSRDVAGVFDAVSRALRTALAALRYEVAVFACLGLWTLRRRFDALREATLWLPAAAYAGVLVLLVWGAGYVARRHALAPMLPLAAYAAVGWRGMHRAAVARWAPRLRPMREAPAVTLVLVLALCVVWGPRDLRPRRLDRVPVRQAAQWLAEEVGEGRAVAAQKGRVAYYARGRFVPLPSGRDGPIRESLIAAGAEWVVIDEARLDDHRGLAAGLGDWLQVAHVETGSGRRVVVLELR